MCVCDLNMSTCQIPIHVCVYWPDSQQRGIYYYYYCSSVCCNVVSWQTVVGVIYNFVLEQLFAAKKGGGATMNGEPIHVSSCTGQCPPSPSLATPSLATPSLALHTSLCMQSVRRPC